MGLLIFNWVCLILLAWIPIDMAIQGLHQYNLGRKFVAAGMFLAALLINIFLISAFNAPS